MMSLFGMRRVLLLVWLLSCGGGSFWMCCMAEGSEAGGATQESETPRAACDCATDCRSVMEAEKATAVQQTRASWEVQVKTLETEMQTASRDWDARKDSYEEQLRLAKKDSADKLTETEGLWQSKLQEAETAAETRARELEADMLVRCQSQMSRAEAEATARTQKQVEATHATQLQEAREAAAVQLAQATEAARQEQAHKLQELKAQFALQLEDEKAAVQTRVSQEASETHAKLVRTAQEEAETAAQARYDEMVKNYEAKLQAANFRSSAYKTEQEEWEEKYRTATHELREAREEGRKNMAKEKVTWQAQTSKLEKQVASLEEAANRQADEVAELQQQLASEKEELELARKDSSANVYCNLGRLSSHVSRASVEAKDWLLETAESSAAVAWTRRRVLQPIVTHTLVVSVVLPVGAQVAEQVATQWNKAVRNGTKLYKQHVEEHVEPSLAILRNAVESLYISAIFGVEMASDVVAKQHLNARAALDLDDNEEDPSALRTLILAACSFCRNNAEAIVRFWLMAFAVIVLGPLLLEWTAALLWCVFVWPFFGSRRHRRSPPPKNRRAAAKKSPSSSPPVPPPTAFHAAKNGTTTISKPGKPSQRMNGGKRMTKKE